MSKHSFIKLIISRKNAISITNIISLQTDLTINMIDRLQKHYKLTL